LLQSGASYTSLTSNFKPHRPSTDRRICLQIESVMSQTAGSARRSRE
jgi:hypothetical protein